MQETAASVACKGSGLERKTLNFIGFVFLTAYNSTLNLAMLNLCPNKYQNTWIYLDNLFLNDHNMIMSFLRFADFSYSLALEVPVSFHSFPVGFLGADARMKRFPLDSLFFSLSK